MKTKIAIIIAALTCAGCFSIPKTPPPVEQCGSLPENYKSAITTHLSGVLIDPYSAHEEFQEPIAGWGPHKEACWIVKVWVNAHNRLGGYTGRQPFWYYIKDGKIVGIATPELVANSNWDASNPLQ